MEKNKNPNELDLAFPRQDDQLVPFNPVVDSDLGLFDAPIPSTQDDQPDTREASKELPVRDFEEYLGKVAVGAKLTEEDHRANRPTTRREARKEQKAVKAGLAYKAKVAREIQTQVLFQDAFIDNRATAKRERKARKTARAEVASETTSEHTNEDMTKPVYKTDTRFHKRTSRAAKKAAKQSKPFVPKHDRGRVFNNYVVETPSPEEVSENGIDYAIELLSYPDILTPKQSQQDRKDIRSSEEDMELAENLLNLIEQHGSKQVVEVATSIRDTVLDIVDNAQIQPDNLSRSISWVLWEFAQTPEALDEIDAPYNPEDPDLIEEIAERRIGLLAYRSLRGKTPEQLLGYFGNTEDMAEAQTYLNQEPASAEEPLSDQALVELCNLLDDYLILDRG